MEHLENDMDDLFQKAGELYPLKISGSDWEGVSGKLQDKNFGDLNTGPDLSSGTRNRRRWRLLVLLIPLGLAGIIYSTGILNKKASITAPEAVKQTSSGNGQDPNTIPGNPAGATGNDKVHQAADNRSVSQNSPKNNDVSGKSVDRASAAAYNKNADLFAKRSSVINNGYTGKKNSEEKNFDKLGNRQNDNLHTNTENANKNTSGEKVKTEQQSDLNSVPPPVIVPAETSGTDMNKSTQTKTTKTTGMDSAVATKKADPVKKTSSGFYAGILVGPDLSTVHTQSVNQIGYSLGVMAGYRFNKRLSVETGLLWDRKYYYSTGEYFSTDKIHVPYYWNITDVDGNCNMWEIPLALKYDFSAKNNHSFFAKAGLSSYIMTKQNYSFGLDSAGVQKKTNYIPYNNTLNYFFSIVQFSAGYELAIGRNTNIRVEPYVKIPLQGVGTGDMPISSVGIYFGITHSFR